MLVLWPNQTRLEGNLFSGILLKMRYEIYDKNEGSFILVGASGLAVATKTFDVGELCEPGAELNRLLFQMGGLLETHLSGHLPQKLLLPVSFCENRQRHLSEIFPQGQVQKWISGLFPVHADGSIVSAQVTNPQSFHIEQHLVFHLLVSCPLEGYPVPGIPSEDLICP
jgi:hypothetical protein